MQISLRATCAALAIITLCAEDASAGNLSFLEDSAIAKFDDEDVRLMTENVRAVVEDSKTPAERSWKNPTSGHSGKIESLKTFVGRDGLSCKKLRITNVAGDLRSRATYAMCKSSDGDWRLAPQEERGPSQPTNEVEIDAEDVVGLV